MNDFHFPTRTARKGYFVHVRSHHGHRAGYQTLFAERLGLMRSTGHITGRRFFRLLAAKYVLFATIDGEYLGVVILALLRAIRGRPTVGLFLRPQTAFKPGLKYRPKKLFFSLARRIPHFHLLTIVPFDLRPEYASVANGWIHDPELWDLIIRDCETLPTTTLSDRIEAAAGGRAVLAFLGSVTKAKGFDVLCDLLEADPCFADRMMVVIAGRVAKDLRARADRLRVAGALVEDRYLEDDEILSLYGVADFVWCVYDPAYDQASGIFGRSFQTGCTALVREGSIIEDQARAVAGPHISIAPLRDPPKLSRLSLLNDRTKERNLSPKSIKFARRALDIVELKK